MGEISLNLVLAVQEQLFKDIFLFLALTAIIFSGAGPFEGLQRNIWVEFKLSVQKTLFSGHFVLWIGTILAIFIISGPYEEHLGEINTCILNLCQQSRTCSILRADGHFV